jgi:hypothetical protein
MDLAVLDVAIGLILMYVLISLLVTTIQEAIASALSLRSRNLVDAIANLLEESALDKHGKHGSLTVEFYRHPLIQSLYRRDAMPAPGISLDRLRKCRLPSYLPSRTFAIVLLDVLRKRKKPTEIIGINGVLSSARELIADLPAGSLRSTLELLVADADGLAADANERASLISGRIETWFNDSMARASGWYKREAQKLSLAIGMAAAVAINANTLSVAETLWKDKSVRGEIAAVADQYYHEHGGRLDEAAKQRQAQMQTLLALPVGWSAATTPDTAEGWLRALFGWFATGMAASLGAAFWFDVLGRALQIRGSGGKILTTTVELQRPRNELPAPPQPSEVKSVGARADVRLELNSPETARPLG